MTYDQLVVRIIDALNVGERLPEGVLARPVARAEIEAEIQRAIEFYSTTRFQFNEGTATLTTSSSLAVYNFPADLMEIDSVLATCSGSKFPLRQVSYAEMNERDPGTVFGVPSSYAIWAEQIRLYPCPSGTFTIALAYQKRLPTITGTASTNAWTETAQDLISARVISRVCAWRLRDPERSMAFASIEAQELGRLQLQNQKTATSGRLAPND